MIFNKEVVFPYPVLSPFNDDYPEAAFNCTVEFIEHPNEETYEFLIGFEITSKFLKGTLEKNQAKIMVIIQSKDSKIYDFIGKSIMIPKNRISLRKRTSIQLMLVAESDISFASNNDLHPIYRDYRHNIEVLKNQVIALSKVERFDGDLKKPYELFKYNINDKLDTEIQFELNSEVIVINLKDGKYLYPGKPKEINYHYVYIGLERALTQFILQYCEEQDFNINLNDLEPPVKELDLKIYNLLRSKSIESIDLESLDKIIHQMTDRLVETHYRAIEKGSRE